MLRPGERQDASAAQPRCVRGDHLRAQGHHVFDGESIAIGAGEALCVPRGAVHGFQNGGGTDATFLAIASPGVFGPAYFREVGEVLATSAGGPPDVAALAEVMRRHGLTPAQPATT